MVLPLLVACDEEDAIDNITKDAEEYTTTLNMWMITESQLVSDVSKLIVSGLTPNKKVEDLTEEQKATVAAMTDEQKAAWNQVYAVSEAVNKLTKADHRTKLNLMLYTEAEYYTALEAAFVEHEKNIAAGNLVSKNDREETVLNEYGIPELKYPVVPAYEVDILFLGNYEKYATYAQKGWLTDMLTHLEEAGLKLNSYVNNDFLRAAAINSSIYALPNNHGIGEYVYVMADKKLMSDYDATGALETAGIYDSAFAEYLEYIYTNYNGSNGTKVYPIYSETGKVDIDYAHYWSFDVDSKPGHVIQNPDQFFLFGDAYAGAHSDRYTGTTENPATGLANNNLLTDATYMKALENKTHYEHTEGYITADKESAAAIRIVKGGWELKAEYEAKGYEVLVMQYPQLDNDEVFSSMFAIGKYSVNDDRASEIITYINTNAEIRNVLLYGVEETNYNFKTVTIGDETYQYVEEAAGNLYKMDIKKTGNEFLAYPASADDVQRWAYDKQQNLEMQRYPTLGLNFAPEYTLDAKTVRVMNAVSAGLARYLDTFTTKAEVSELFNTAFRATRNGNEAFATLLLERIGEVKYMEGTAEVAVTVEILTAALAKTKVDAVDPAAGATQSTYALYKNWCYVNGYLQPPAAE